MAYGDVRVLYADHIRLRRASPLRSIGHKIPFCHQSTFTRTALLRERPFQLCYKIAADYHLFHTLWRERGEAAFVYMPLCVSAVDAADSLTYRQKYRCKREYLAIRAGHKDLRWFYDHLRLDLKRLWRRVCGKSL